MTTEYKTKKEAREANRQLFSDRKFEKEIELNQITFDVYHVRWRLRNDRYAPYGMGDWNYC